MGREEVLTASDSDSKVVEKGPSQNLTPRPRLWGNRALKEPKDPVQQQYEQYVDVA